MDHNIEVIGFKSNIDDVQRLLSNINSISVDCTVQILRADGIAGKKHALHSAWQALLAFERGDNIAKDIGLEICLRAAAQRQITRAIKILGIKNGKQNICAILIDCDPRILNFLEKTLGERDDRVIKADINQLRNLYNITDTEIRVYGNLERLMVERTSLLVLEN
jgi:KEOPS complex subunit Cgi121